MAILTSVLVGLGAVGSAVAARLIAEEGKSWLPWLAQRVVRQAVAMLPQELRERMEEEWRRHLEDVPGEIGKVVVAVGFAWASYRISLDSGMYSNPFRFLSNAYRGLFRNERFSALAGAPAAIGERVRIRTGSLEGMEGVLLRRKGSFRVVLSLDLIMQTVAVEVDAENVERIDGA